MTTAAIGSGAGALAGGALAYLGAMRQTDRTIAATRDAEEERRKQERTEARRRRTEDAAAALLVPLADARDAVPAMAQKNMTPRSQPSSVGQDQQVFRALNGLRLAQRTVLPLIDDEAFHKRWNHLIIQAEHLANTPADAIRKNRDLVDLESYLGYVQLSVEALIKGEPIPADVALPNYLRDTDESWEPDPKPDGWE